MLLEADKSYQGTSQIYLGTGPGRPCRVGPGVDTPRTAVAPMWPKSYHTIGPKSTFLCHLVRHRTLSKTLSNTFTLSQFPLLCYMFDDVFVWMGKISGADDDNN